MPTVHDTIRIESCLQKVNEWKFDLSLSSRLFEKYAIANLVDQIFSH